MKKNLLLKICKKILGVDERSQKVLGDKIGFAKDQYAAIEGADALIIATEWALFRTPQFEKLQEKIKDKVIFDGRNLYEVAQMQELGFSYYSVGRKSA